MIAAPMTADVRADDELSALAGLAGDEWQRAVDGIAGTHASIAARAFGATGPSAAAVRAAHDVIASTAYLGVRAGGGALGRFTARALAARTGERPALSQGPAGASALAVLSGLSGDRLAREGSVLAPEMSLRARGRVVPPDRAALAHAFPDATERLCVFLHGLMESEFAWGIGADGQGTYGRALVRRCGFTPLYVRYNSGRHISENGRALSALLDAVVAAAPATISEIALVGHSMGGLVARSACHGGQLDGAPWVALVRHTVSIGTPHHGAPIPRALDVADAALHAVPETRALGGLLRRRSDGIRDLRHGSLVDEDWRGRDRDALRAAAVAEVPLLDGATHSFVSATVTRSPSHPVGRVIGDTLVLPRSAEGRERRQRLEFSESHGLRLGGTHHLALLRHPEVSARLCAWLGDAAR